MQSNFEYHPNWMQTATTAVPSSSLALAPGSWDGPESRQESPASAQKAVKLQSPSSTTTYPVVVDSRLNAKSSNFRPASQSPYSNNNNNNNVHNNSYSYSDYASYSPTPLQHTPQQQYPSSSRIYSTPTPIPTTQQHDLLSPQQNDYYRDSNDSTMSLFSNMSYSAWMEQQQQDFSESYGSPQPKRSIWSSTNKDHSNGSSNSSPSPSPVGAPLVYEPSRKEEDLDMTMSRLSLIGATGQTMKNKQRGGGGSRNQQQDTGSVYSNIPGLVQASSESTTSAYTQPHQHQRQRQLQEEPSWGGNKPPDHDSFQERMASSLRSVLSDDEDDDEGGGADGLWDGNYSTGHLSIPSPQQQQQQNLQSNYNMGNSHTRRNRQRNRVRQANKKKQEGGSTPLSKALKERNDNTSSTAAMPSPRIGSDLKLMSSSLQQAVNRQQAAGSSTPTNNNNRGNKKDAARTSKASSEALRMLMSGSNSQLPRYPTDDAESNANKTSNNSNEPPILPQQLPVSSLMALDFSHSQDHSEDTDESDDILLQHMLLEEAGEDGASVSSTTISVGKKRDWLLRMNKKLQEIPIGELDPSTVPVSAIMNAWAKTKSAQGASMVELWLKRAQEEYSAGNHRIIPTTKMYTMAGT